MRRKRFACLAAALVIMSTSCSVLPNRFVADLGEGKSGAEVIAQFENATGFSLGRLLNVVDPYMRDLSKDPQRDAAAQDAALDVEDLYREYGYPDVSVKFRIERRKKGAPPDAPIVVVFEVEPGPQVVVTKLTISGNKSVKTSELRELWERRLSGFLGLGRPLFVESDLNAFANAIRARYLGQGWLEVEVDGPKITRAPGSNEAEVAFVITEGTRFKVGKLIMSDALREAFGKALPKFPSGSLLSMQEIEEFSIACYRGLRRLGYPDPQLKRALRVNRKEQIADVVIDGQPGKKMIVTDVEIEGNQKTATAVIRAKIDIQKGQLFNGDKEDEARRKLQETGFFSKIDIVHEPAGEGMIKIVFKLTERETGSVEIEFPGWGSYEKLHGLIRLSERNIFGTGFGASALARLSTKGYRYQLGIQDPALFSTKARFDVSGEFQRRERPSYVDRYFQTTTAVSYPLARRVVSRLGYRFNTRIDARAEVSDPAALLTDFNMGSVFLELSQDKRDNPIVARTGHREHVGIEVVDDVLGGDVNFVRMSGRVSAYSLLTEAVGLAVNAETGVIFPGDGTGTVPVQERWFNGGENTVRSYRQDQLGPKDAFGQPTGGEFRNIFNLEFRIQPDPKRSPFSLAIFGDAGNVGFDVKDYGFRDMGYAIGTGLRAGPVRLDFGYNPHRKPGDDVWVIHFSIGQAF